MEKIQYCSDLHLEFSENKEFMDDHPLEKAGDILIMAGDIVPFSELDDFGSFFDELSEKYEAVYWVPGNHEYYNSNIEKHIGKFKEEIRDNIYLLNNTVVEREGVRLIFSTLWTALTEKNRPSLSSQWPDFQEINKGDGEFFPSDYNDLFQENLEFLKEELSNEKDVTTIVVTHHVPIFEKFAANQRNNPLNETFAVDLSDMIKETQPDYWIYGHDHQNVDPIEIGKTKLLTNQLGYVKYDENKAFSQDATVGGG